MYGDTSMCVAEQHVSETDRVSSIAKTRLSREQLVQKSKLNSESVYYSHKAAPRVVLLNSVLVQSDPQGGTQCNRSRVSVKAMMAPHNLLRPALRDNT